MADESPITEQLLDSVRTQESGGNPFAVSARGAMGPYQFMPGTAKQFGVSNPFDPVEARAGAKKALQHYYDKFGSVEKALQAYNQGEGAVARGAKPPKETRDYVKSIGGMQGKKGKSAPVSNNPFESIAVQPKQTAPADRQTFPEAGAVRTQGMDKATPQGQADPHLPSFLQHFGKGVAEGVRGIPQAADLFSLGGLYKAFQGKPGAATEVYDATTSKIYQTLKENSPEVAKALDFENIPEPRDAFGAKRTLDQKLGKVAEFMGTGLVQLPFGLAGAEKKLPFIISEAMMSASGGYWYSDGAELGKDLAKKYGMDPKKGEMIGGMLTSFIAPIITKTVLTKGFAGAKGLFDRMTPGGRERAAKENIQKEIERAKTHFPQTEANVREVELLRSLGLNINPFLARATGAPEQVAKYEEALRSDPSLLSRGAAEEAAMKAEAQRFREEKFAPGTVTAQAGAEAGLAAESRALNKQIQDSTAQIQQLAAKPAKDSIAAGAEIKKALDTHFDLRQKRAAMEYRGVDAEAKARNFNLSSQGFYGAISKIAGRDAAAWEEASPTVARILRDFAPTKQTATQVSAITGTRPVSSTISPTIAMPAWRGMIRKINRDLGELYESGSPDARSQARTLQAVKDAIEAQGMKEMQGKGDLAQRWRNAQNFYADAIGKPFREGTIKQVRKWGKNGEVTVPSAVVEKIWKTPEGQEQYFAATKGDPAARKSYVDGVLDMFYSKFGTSGEIDVNAATKWMNQSKNSRNLNAIPELKQALADKVSQTNAILQRRQELTAAQKALDDSVVAQFAKTSTPNLFLDNALKDPAKLQGLVNSMKGNPEALKSLASSLAARMADIPNIEQFMKNNEEYLKPVMNQLGKDHWQNLQAIAAEQRIRGRVTTPTAVTTPKPKGIVEETIGTKPQSILARLGGAVRPSQTFANVWLGSNFFMKLSEKSRKAAFEAAYFNPDVTKVLADIQRHGPTKTRTNELKAHLFSHGIRIAIVAGNAPGDQQ